MEYSPKLKKAMAEIKDILTKYDIAGTIVLHNVESVTGNYIEGYSEYLFHLMPSYSCIKKEANDQIRIRAKLEDYNGDKEKQNKHIHTTANMLIHLTDMNKMIYRNVERFSYTLDNIINAEHDEGSMSPDIGLRN